MLRNIANRVEEMRNPVNEENFGERMRRLYTVRDVFASPAEARDAARAARRRFFGAVVSVFERAGFWRVKAAA